MSTVAAISTPVAAGGIGMIRISGEDAIAVASRCFRPVTGKPVSEMPGYTAAYGSVFDETGEIDDGVLIVYRAPKSYTGENVAEICCHGGLLLLQKTIADSGLVLASVFNKLGVLVPVLLALILFRELPNVSPRRCRSLAMRRLPCTRTAGGSRSRSRSPSSATPCPRRT